MTPDLKPEGVLCPLITPFSNKTVDHTTLTSLIDHVRDGGIDGLVPCGTTGEFASLSHSEHENVIRTTVDNANDLPVIAGAAGTSEFDVNKKIETASSAGADGVLITLPYFHGANKPEGQSNFFEAIADTASIPIYLYNIPACTGQQIDLDVLEQVAAHEQIVGLKDSSGDFNYFTEALRRTPEDFQLFEGYDSQLFAALTSGATGGVNALSNVIPDSFSALQESIEAGNIASARRIQSTQISPLFQECLEHGFAPVCKAGLAAQGVIDSSATRPPLVSLSGDAQERIKSLVNRSP
jgi:4-hydroxy-tetrahydrodipicolinate synthase